MIRTLMTGAVAVMALAAASCARNQSHDAHADHEPAKKLQLEKPAASVPEIVEPAAATPAAMPTSIEPDEKIGEEIGEKPKAKPRSVRRPKPAAQTASAPEETRPAASPAPEVEDEHAGHDGHQHHHH